MRGILRLLLYIFAFANIIFAIAGFYLVATDIGIGENGINLIAAILLMFNAIICIILSRKLKRHKDKFYTEEEFLRKRYR